MSDLDLNEVFLRAAFGAEWRRALVISFVEDPTGAPSGAWTASSVGARIRRGAAAWPLDAGANNYFCVSLFLGEHRLETDFQELRVLAVDDVGVKVDAGTLLDRLGTPAWAVETSPGNQQWFWLVDPPLRDLGKARRLTRLVGNDAKGVTRVMRLPVGTNTKSGLGSGHAARVVARGAGGIGLVDAEALLRELDAAGGGVPGRGVGGGGGMGARNTQPGATVVDLIGDDPVGVWLSRWGRVKGLTPSRLGVEIVCPWESEHTVRTSTGTAYFPKTGGFECHHGHCADRTGADLKAWVESELDRSGLWEGGVAGERFEPAEDGDDGSEAMKPLDAAQRAIARYVYVTSEHRLLDLKTNLPLLPEAFNHVQTVPLRPWLQYQDAKKQVRLMTPFVWFRSAGRIVDAQTYWPGRDRVFEDEVDGRALVNRWRPGTWRARGGSSDWAAISPWVELIEALVINEGAWVPEVMFDWFALVISAPGVKPGWHPVWHSEVHGVGKDMGLWPVRLAVGEENVGSPSPAVIGGTFNEYAEKRLVVVTDLERNTRGALTTHDIYETIKPYTENTSRMITIHRKFAQPYQAANTSGWVITTNARDALPLADSDRRFFVVSSTMVRRGDDYYARMRAWLDAHWPDVAEALHARWVSMPDNRKAVLLGRAPMTTGKATMALLGEDRLTAWTRDRIESGAWPDLMTSQDVQDAYDRAGRGVLGMPPPTSSRWRQVLTKLGARQVYGGNAVRLENIRSRIWAVRKPERFDGFSEKDIATSYDLCRNF